MFNFIQVIINLGLLAPLSNLFMYCILGELQKSVIKYNAMYRKGFLSRGFLNANGRNYVTIF